MMKKVFLFIALFLLTPQISIAQIIDVHIEGVDDGIKTSKQQDYKEAVLFAKREAIERAGVKIKSSTTVKDLIVTSDYIESQAEAILLPGYNVVDVGYQTDGTYLVVLIGKVDTNIAVKSRAGTTDKVNTNVAVQSRSGTTNVVFGKATGLTMTSYRRPIPNREVHLITVSGSSYSVFATTNTDSQGRWVVDEVPPGMYASWHGAINVTIGSVHQREVIAGQTTDFGVHSESVKNDPFFRDQARSKATPYNAASSSLRIDGIYFYKLDDSSWKYLRFFEDGTVSEFGTGTPPEKTIDMIKDPLRGYWSPFEVNDSNIKFATFTYNYVTENYNFIRKWNCHLIEGGKKLKCTEKTKIGSNSAWHVDPPNVLTFIPYSELYKNE